jgi:hypothetical protein
MEDFSGRAGSHANMKFDAGDSEYKEENQLYNQTSDNYVLTCGERAGGATCHDAAA